MHRIWLGGREGKVWVRISDVSCCCPRALALGRWVRKVPTADWATAGIGSIDFVVLWLWNLSPFSRRRPRVVELTFVVGSKQPWFVNPSMERRWNEGVIGRMRAGRIRPC